MDWTIIAAVAIIALIGAAFAGWAMWLEHRQQLRLLEIVANSLESGRDPPPELLERLVDGRASPDRARSGRAVRRTAALFLALSGACFLASWAVTDAAREQALLFVTVITALMGLGLVAIQNFGSRLGL